MSEWKRKRFWADATVTEEAGTFRIALDGREVKTPAKRALALPTAELAEAVAEEWRTQGDEVDPRTMPLTRLSNSALDTVMLRGEEVANMVAAYGATDLVCYRADHPMELVARQAAEWDPMLEWAADTLRVELVVQTGLMPVNQPAASLDRIGQITRGLDAFALTALHELVALSGSWVMGYAALRGAKPPQAVWQASLVDELFQAEHWGDDDDALEVRHRKEADFMLSHRFHSLATAHTE